MSGRLLAALVGGLLLLSACGTGVERTSPTTLRGTVRIALVHVFSGQSGYLGEYVQPFLKTQICRSSAAGLG